MEGFTFKYLLPAVALAKATYAEGMFHIKNFGVAKIGLVPFLKKFLSRLFVFWGIECAFLHIHIWFLKSFGAQHITATKHKGYNTGHLEVKKKCRRGDPVVGKILILDFFQFLVEFLIIIHIPVLWCKNKGLGLIFYFDFDTISLKYFFFPRK